MKYENNLNLIYENIQNWKMISPTNSSLKALTKLAEENPVWLNLNYNNSGLCLKVVSIATKK